MRRKCIRAASKLQGFVRAFVLRFSDGETEEDTHGEVNRTACGDSDDSSAEFEEVIRKWVWQGPENNNTNGHLEDSSAWAEETEMEGTTQSRDDILTLSQQATVESDDAEFRRSEILRWLEEGIMFRMSRTGTMKLRLFGAGREWHRIPNEIWAWKGYGMESTCQRCKRHGFHNGCRHGKSTSHADGRPEYERMRWRPVLLCKPEAKHMQSVRRQLKSPSRPSRMRNLARLLPPELFERIYEWQDIELARTCRAVCRYWEKRCRSAAFTSIQLQSEEMAFDFVREPALRQVRSLAETINLPCPSYTSRAKGPWLHRLDPRWTRDELVIEGPFPGRRTLRSIHFGLPRSPPPSFSRGFTRVTLKKVRMGRFEDTTCLASELPDLERLALICVTWDSLPTELPRRRPRANRNNLRWIKFRLCSVKGVERPSFAFAAWTLVLGVSRPSPFDSLDATHALVQAVHADDRLTVTVDRDCEGRVSGLDIVPYSRGAVLRRRSEESTGKNLLFLFLNPARSNKDLPLWSQLNSAIALLPLSWHLRFLFGFPSQEDMRQSAADIVEKQLTSLVGRAEVRFTIVRDSIAPWHGATLQFKEQEGKGVKDPIGVYADWQEIFQSPKQVQNATLSNTA